VLQEVRNAERAHIHTRTLLSRLRMRPHADPALVESALDAATSMYTAIEHVRRDNARRRAAEHAAGQSIVISAWDPSYVEPQTAERHAHIEEFEAQARAAVSKLLT
jgi:hypothetical protein